MIIRSKFSNLSNWREEAWKKSGLQRDSNPWPPRYRCVALPTELWGHIEVNLFSSYLPWGVKWCVLLSNCLNWKIYCDDHSSLSSTTAIQKWIISYILHIVSNFIDHAISFNLSNAGKIFWTESERTVSEFRKRKKKLFCVAFTYSVKRAREIRKFHVAVLQGWLKNVQKRVMHVQSSCFYTTLGKKLVMRKREELWGREIENMADDFTR